MTSPLAANPRAIAPQQRPASPALPPSSLSQPTSHTTIPALHPPNVPLVSSSHTTSPAVASLGVTPAAPSNGAATTTYPPPLPMAAYPQTQPSYPPLYTPYAPLNHSPYLPPAVPSPSHSASSRTDLVSQRVILSFHWRPHYRFVELTTERIINPCLFPLQRGSRASPCTNISKQTIGNSATNHNSSTPLSAATTTCVSTITNTVTTANTIVHRDIVACSLAGRNNNSPRGHSPNRERDSYRYFDTLFIFTLSKATQFFKYLISIYLANSHIFYIMLSLFFIVFEVLSFVWSRQHARNILWCVALKFHWSVVFTMVGLSRLWNTSVIKNIPVTVATWAP